MSWAALPVEPACMGKAVGEAGHPLMLCGARLYIITFKYNTGMEKIELEVIEIDDSSCDGCVFNNRGYYCMYSCCCNIDREDNTDVIYKEVKRS